MKRALLKDGWTITHDPLVLPFGTTSVFVDLGAELPIGAEKAGRQIAVEVKSFLGLSRVTEMERMLGQYVLYRALLRRQDPERVLYVAVPNRVFHTFIGLPDTLDLIHDEKVKLVLFEPGEEVVLSWIE